MRMSCARNAAVVVVQTAGGFALGASSPAVAVPGGGGEARAAGAATAGPTVSLPVPGNLNKVAARSADNAWAVGQTSSDSADSDRPILAHWNGRIWRTVSSPALPARGGLNAVATFPGGGWAVGQSGVLVNGGVPRNLIVSLVGTTARRMPIRGRLTATTSSSGPMLPWRTAARPPGCAIELIPRGNGAAWPIG